MYYVFFGNYRAFVLFSKLASMNQIVISEVLLIISLFSVACFKQSIETTKMETNFKCKHFYQHEELHVDCSNKLLIDVTITPSNTVYVLKQVIQKI